MEEVRVTKDITSIPLPIPVFQAIQIAEMQGKDGDMFVIYAGLDQGMVAQLRERSLDANDTELAKTSDRERFGIGSYEEWYAKDRLPFALIHKPTGKLTALIWFGPKPLGRKSMKHLSTEERAQDERLMDSDNWHTIVYRSYAPFRGKGLMTAFGRFAIDQYRALYPSSRLWAGIYADNPASIGYVTKLGFTILEKASDASSHETVMVWEPTNDTQRA